MGKCLHQRILIVDDIVFNIDLLVETLKDHYDLSVATSGRAALNIISKEIPDLILLDIMMPEMDGYEVCRRLKSNPETEEIPVIFVTARDDARDETFGFEAGCVDYMTKPINPAIVMARVKTHLELKKIRENLERKNKELIDAAKLREDVERITRHDLKNPLTGIFTGIDLLEFDGHLNQNQEETIKIIKESAHKMLSMINLSMDLFKMEQEIYRINPTDVDLIEIIRKVKKELGSLFTMKKILLNIKIEDKSLQEKQIFIVNAENLLCYSMFMNLIKNALESSPKYETITLLLSKTDYQAQIILHNRGTVPKEIEKTFFEKYVTKGKLKGTGLGTYSAKLIAKTMNGNIAMETTRKNGTSLFITLPIAR